MKIVDFDLDRALRGIPDDSPCNSPIENIFYAEIQKHFASNAHISRQFECPTPIGNFLLDFLIEIRGVAQIGFECDGKEFHDSARDSVRDKAIIDEGFADRIYRLRGRDLYFRLHDTLDIVRARESELFSERGLLNIKTLATRDTAYKDFFYSNGESGFPFGVARWYLWDDELEYYGFKKENFEQPTVVRWT